MIVPRELFKRAERYLHEAEQLAAEKRIQIEELRKRLYSAMPKGISQQGGGQYRESAVERNALRIDALRRELEELERWCELRERVRGHFAERKESILFAAFYGCGQSVNQFARAQNYDRQTVDNYRDKVVSIYLMLAAEAGLIVFEEWI